MKRRGRKSRGAACRAHAQGRRGVATVEFAVVAPLILLLLLGTIDVGQYVNVAQTVSNASREGARLAARDTTETAAEVNAAVLGYFAACFPGIPEAAVNDALNVTVRSGDGVALTNLTGVNTGSALSVEVQFDFSSVRWLSGASLISNSALDATSTMRRE